jgi:transposase
MKTTENTKVQGNEEALTAEERIARLEQENQELKAEINFFKEQFKLSQLQKYGKSSEKSHPEQLVLFNEAEVESVKKHEELSTEEILVRRKRKKNAKGHNFEDLPIEEIRYEFTDEEMSCPNCDGTLHEMKTEVRKELKVIPAQIKVIHHIKQVYACRTCDAEGTSGTIITAPAPKPALPGSFASSSILAYTIEKKYNQAIPLYRQETTFRNLGYEISRQNLANWTIKASDKWLRIIFDRMHEHLLKEDIIHADETTLNVLDEKDNKNNYMWLYTTGKECDHKICLYDYQKSRSKKNPKNFLTGFAGYLQTDGYQAYESVGGVSLLGCLAHARRYFKKALDAAPKEADIAKSKSAEALAFFTKIYKIDKSLKELSPEERFIERIDQVEPIMIEFHNWLEVEKKKTLPKSLLGQAIKYCLKQWPKLIGVLCDGRLELDNNRAERAIRPFTIGRKNWTFSKSPLGATISGICYSIVETANQNNLIPFEYIMYLFDQLPNIDISNTDVLDALLPWSKDLPDNIKLKTLEN